MIETDENDNIIFGSTYLGWENNYIEWRGDTIVKEPSLHGKEVIFLAKMDTDGNLLWHQLLKNEDELYLHSLKTDHENNIVMLIQSNYPFTAFGQNFESGINLIKLNTDGEFLWSQYLQRVDISYFNAGHMVSIACDDDILLSGDVGQVPYDMVPYEINDWDTLWGQVFKYDTMTIDGYAFAADTHNFFIVRFSPEGNLKWGRVFEHNGWIDVDAIDASTPYDISILGAYRHEDWHIADTVLAIDTSYNSQTPSMFIMTLDENGEIKWVRRYFRNTYPTHISHDYEGNLLLLGNFHTSTYSDEDTITEENNSGDLLIFKTDNEGNYLWGTHTGNSQTNQGGMLIANEPGEIYLGGGLSNLIGPILNKYDAYGSQLWSLDPIGSSNRIGEDLSLDRSGNLIVMGYFGGVFNIGGHILEHSYSYSNYIIKFKSEENPVPPSKCEVISEVEQIASINDISIFPNPVTDNVIIQSSVTGKFNVTIYDLNGHVMMETFQNGNSPLLIDTTEWAAGMYAVQIRNGMKSISNIFVVMRK